MKGPKEYLVQVPLVQEPLLQHPLLEGLLTLGGFTWASHYFAMPSGQQLIFQRIDESVVNGCFEKVVYLSLEITHGSGSLMLRSESSVALLRKSASCQSS